ncbi:MAG: hypothetical protein ABII90_11915 [Bacteroidota bacterium]
MAKTEMMCPFSEMLCIECPQYRGRHFYLCFNDKYRGYLGDQKKAKQRTGLRGVKNFEMPSHLTPSPTWLILNKLIERKYYGNQ